MASDKTEARRRGVEFETHASPRLSASAPATHNSGSTPHDEPVMRDERTTNEERETSDARAATDDRAAIDDRAMGSDRVARTENGTLTVRGYERISKFLTAKSLAETLFLVALIAVFSYTHFNPRLRGTLDAADARAVSGWVVDEADPARQVEVELYIDDHFVARRRADAPREDVRSAGRAPDARHGYVFETPRLPAREAAYEARVFAVHEGEDRERIGLQKVGQSLFFKVQPDERSAAAPEKWWEDLQKR